MKHLKTFNEEVWFIDKINKYKIDKICKKILYEKLTKLQLKFNKIDYEIFKII